ncbi:30S ribosomal protein S8 [Catenaria anguillulae PL171]|uniref:30S ribosomal protein S8 n=1 Tax=Catenaria anguillulae PL171 TaxID=765915 RepID=A0A1Y2H5X4_9FUNG|nr:30S ribosomal protein S8 [Catenaria anguillulae PL171]
MPQIHNVCSHLQNAFRARLRSTSVPHSNLNLSLLSLLRDQGFLSAVMAGSPLGPHQPALGVAQRRLWVNLKYSGPALDSPLLQEMKTVSKPSRRVFATHHELAEVASGRKCRRLQQLGLKLPLVPGEVVAINTEQGVLDLHSAVKQGLGGEVLCTAK